MTNNTVELLQPTRLWSRAEVLARPCPVPRAAGVYAWYFRGLDRVPATECVACGDFRLLYVGISPSAPPVNGKSPSRQNLYQRVRYHMQGNAEGSTLRLSLGCLLADELGIELRRVGSGNRMTFSSGEQRLSEWLADSARVVWTVYDQPRELEERLIQQCNLPINLDQNRNHAFHAELSELRRKAKRKARKLPVVAPQHNIYA